MKQKSLFSLIAFVLAVVVYYYVEKNPQQTTGKSNETIETPVANPTKNSSHPAPVQKDAEVDLTDLEIPALIKDHQIIRYSGFTVSYNEKHEQADWVAYELTSEETRGSAKRTDRFVSDPQVQTGSATKDDYKGSGYDRGHLAPAGDMKWSKKAMQESFFFTNMSPQKPAFNRGIWRLLEEQVRDWAKENEAIYVITGSKLEDGLPTIGENKVSVPKYYYKVILDYNGPEVKGIGFIFPNEGSKKPLSTFAVSIDSVEEFVGMDFFHKLPDATEEALESQLDLSQWEL
ncbi:DNA/RNA non-specific endonuclease [Rapidithrix thailandica]|uniref:Endonuclease n=1 Tax=Rapidithrix thailandica TaxID=413964 RepID=A0AAW9SDF7_9BACT